MNSGDLDERIDGETTVLHAEARRVIEHHVARLGKAVKFLFTTKNPAIYAWAEVHGQRIFDWERQPDEPSANGVAFVASKMFEPESRH